MAKQVVMSALLKCSQGVAPSALIVLPVNGTMAGFLLAANVMDYIPLVNILTFGMCNSKSNPVVITATAAAQGVHTPMPCIPMTTSPWSPGSPTVKIGGQKALNDESTCKCSWNGTIEVSNPGQTSVDIP